MRETGGYRLRDSWPNGCQVGQSESDAPIPARCSSQEPAEWLQDLVKNRDSHCAAGVPVLTAKRRRSVMAHHAGSRETPEYRSPFELGYIAGWRMNSELLDE
jgi:hypothetical protein